jgi:hypothetical protein
LITKTIEKEVEKSMRKIMEDRGIGNNSSSRVEESMRMEE